MKNTLFTVFRILIGLVLLGKILNWFLDFNDELNQTVNRMMFSLIGIAYIVIGYVFENKLLKFVITTCGVFLIVMNFFTGSVALNIGGIACILVPMLIARFYREKASELNTQEG